MKKLLFLLSLIFAACNLFAQTTVDTTGLPGDHFDLYAMLDVFKASSSPEDFEKRLNLEATHVNNLDLNKDAKVDYVRVVDYSSGKNHALALQVPVNEKESQDIAVIEMEWQGENSVRLQVRGDELLYGKDYFIQPGIPSDTNSVQEKKIIDREQTFVFVNVWYWPCVTYMYYPAYVVWVSPWYWMYWPSWWYPWSPVVWIVYYDWVSPYHYHHHHWHESCMSNAYNVYAPRRVVSQKVTAETAEARRRNETRASQSTVPAPPAPSKPAGTPPSPPQPGGDVPQQKPTGAPPKPNVQPAPHPAPAPAPKPTPAPQPKPQPRPKSE